jgi:cytochrome P450
MSEAALLTISPTRRETFKLLRRAVRNPMDAWPAEIYDRRLIRVNLLGAARYYITDPALIQVALVDNADKLHKSDQMRRALEPALGQGILTAEDEQWRTQRRIAAPVFRPSHVNSFLPAMIRAARATSADWQAMPDGSPVEIGHEMMHLTFDIILETMLSGRGDIDMARVEASIADFLKSAGWAVVLAALKAPEWTPFPGKYRASRGRDYLRNMVGARAADRRDTGQRTDDLLSLLLDAKDPETGRGFSDTNITDNLLTFIGAGHETTALALTWTFYLLSKHPDIEAKILAEIHAVTGGAPLEADQIAALKYTSQVIMESMRVYSPVSQIGREVVEGFMLGDVELVPGDRILVPIHAVHHHKLLWDKPDVFDPDRFAPEAIKSRHRFTWLPFGGGPRICIGMQFALLEAVAILATLLPGTRLQARPGYVPVPVSRVTTRPEGGMPMTVERRV